MFMRRWLGVLGVQLRISHLSLWVADASQAEANTIELTPIVHSLYIWKREVESGMEA